LNNIVSLESVLQNSLNADVFVLDKGSHGRMQVAFMLVNRMLRDDVVSKSGSVIEI
jgi:hypothetical protein